VDVRQHDVRGLLVDGGEQRGQVGARPGQLQVGLGRDQARQTLAQQRVVLGHHDPEGHDTGR
jgi:hypothetical protein